jgi:CubicO group peptidase (beta-lactamase class C family)
MRKNLRVFCCVCFAGTVLWGRAAEPSRLAAAMQPFVSNRQMAGAVMLVADKGKVLGFDAVGWADLAAKKKMRTDCLFWIASQSKPMVATALMMLVEEGKVGLDDPVDKYLPEFKDQWLVVEHDREHVLLKKPPHPILVRNLLNHTTGMLYKTPAEQPTLDVLPLDARMRVYIMSPLQFAPGAKHLYANAGINTAARIIEVVSGRSYEQFLAERLLRPLGMKDTTFWPTPAQLRRLAKAYKPNADGALVGAPIPQLRPPFDDPARCVQPAGGLFSTAADLLNFYRMILDGGSFAGRRLLAEETVRQMTCRQTGDLPQAYGFGFDVSRGMVGHGGTFGTVSSLDATRRFISIFLVQYAGPPADLKDFLAAFRAAAADLCAAY